MVILRLFLQFFHWPGYEKFLRSLGEFGWNFNAQSFLHMADWQGLPSLVDNSTACGRDVSFFVASLQQAVVNVESCVSRDCSEPNYNKLQKNLFALLRNVSTELQIQSSTPSGEPLRGR